MAQANTHDSIDNAERADVEHAGVGHPEPGPHYVDHQDDDGVHHVPPALYYKIFGALMVLLFLTWAAAQVEMGVLNVPIALAIAVTKAVLIILYFMHVRFSSRLVWLFSSAAFVFVSIMFFFVLLDYMTRPWFGMSR